MKKIIPFGTYDYEYIEKYLENMAAEGLFLKKKILLLGEFEEGEPRQLKYRIVPQFAGKIDKPEREFYEDLGWQFVTESGGMNIFAGDVNEDEELFSDRQSYEKRCKKFRNGYIIGALNLAVLLYLIVNYFIHLHDGNNGIIHLMDDVGPLSYVFLVICLLPVALLSIVASVKYLAAYLRLKKGIHRTDIKPKTRYRRNMGLYLTVIIIVILTLGCLFIEPDNMGYSMYPGVSESHPVSIKKLDSEFYNSIKIALEEQNCIVDGYCIDADTREYSSLLFSYVKFADAELENAEGEEDVYKNISAKYYEARSEKIAKKYIQEELSSSPPSKNMEITDLSQGYPEADEVYYIENGEYDEMIIVRDGKKMEIVSCFGDISVKGNVKDVVSDVLSPEIQ